MSAAELLDSALYGRSQCEAFCPLGGAPSSLTGPGSVHVTSAAPAPDAAPEGPDDRRQRLTAFIAKVRRMCIDLGAPPALVEGMSGTGLLTLYAELAEQDARRRRDLERLMQEPPRPGR